MPSLQENQRLYVWSFGFFIWFILFIVMVLGTAICWWLTRTYPTVTIQFNNDYCVLPTPDFELKWIHSVEKQWWVERYAVQGDGDAVYFLLTDTFLQTFGAGTPSTQPVINRASDGNHHPSNTLKNEHNDHFNKAYADYVHYRTDIKLPELNWLVSPAIDPQIISLNINTSTTDTSTTDDITIEHALRDPIYLKNSMDGYTAVHLKPVQLSRWKLMQQDACHDHAH